MPIVSLNPTNHLQDGVSSVGAMNLGALRSEVRIYLMNTSDDTDSYSWTDDEIDSYLNEGCFYTQQVTEYFQDMENIVTVAGQQEYELPPEVMQMRRLTQDRQFIPMTNLYELDRDRGDWRDQPADGPIRAFQQQFDDINLFPAPKATGIFHTWDSELGVVTQFTLDDGVTLDTSYAIASELGVFIGMTCNDGSIIETETDLQVNPFSLTSSELGTWIQYSTDEGNLCVQYVRNPDQMELDTDVPQLPIQCHPALIYYAVMKCFNRDGEFHDDNLTQAWFAVYGDWIESILEMKGKEYPDKLESFDPYTPGNLFSKRLSSIGPPIALNVAPSY